MIVDGIIQDEKGHFKGFDKWAIVDIRGESLPVPIYNPLDIPIGQKYCKFLLDNSETPCVRYLSPQEINNFMGYIPPPPPSRICASPHYVLHSALNEILPNELKRECPVCGGMILMRRNPTTFQLLNWDNCTSCNQVFIFMDIPEDPEFPAAMITENPHKSGAVKTPEITDNLGDRQLTF